MGVLLTTAETAPRLRINASTLERWRGASKGPAWLRLGGRIYYQETDVEAWIERQRVDPEAGAMA
ncbi:helix-turn-helix domain-containing protein [Sphingomonas oligophenolica]|uniref:DNA-binding protein n=1 Tax=Sphingomonas oligophenolica TaxID=301154 RepID=A0A502CNB5_9SPHN|nr:helix-turn-helix domain-containing protein [Sphingomonas oligophenolica]TPG13181.1 DNA-binding protein [Sphingomonas oligophenolica]